MPQPKFAKIRITGTRQGIVDISRRGPSRIVIDLIVDRKVYKGTADWEFTVPRSFKPDDMTTYLKNMRRVEPDWYESDDSSGNVIAVKIVGDKIMFAKFATPYEIPEFNLDEIDNALGKAVKAAGG